VQQAQSQHRIGQQLTARERTFCMCSSLFIISAK
jgi:hypothetical protein